MLVCCCCCCSWYRIMNVADTHNNRILQFEALFVVTIYCPRPNEVSIEVLFPITLSTQFHQQNYVT